MTNPHDKLVRRTFGEIAHARGLLPDLLPRKLASRIDWRTLELIDGSFIDPRLTERQTDLLYRAFAGERELLLYVLLEHQSSTDPLMPLRMFVYLGRIWERHLEREPHCKVLPAIVPVVLHHSRTGWSAPRRLREIVHADAAMRDALGELLPELAFHLVDLTREDDQTLRASLATALGRLVALCLKHAPYDPRLELRIPQWLQLLGEVARAPGGVAALTSIGSYLLEVNEITAERLRQVLLQSALEPEALENIMTGADRLREEGRAKGREEGRAEGRAELVLKQLALRFGPLPEDVIARVRAASPEEHERLAEGVIRARSLRELLS